MPAIYKHMMPALYKHMMPALYKHMMPAIYKHMMPAIYKHTMPAIYKHMMPAIYKHMMPAIYKHITETETYFSLYSHPLPPPSPASLLPPPFQNFVRLAVSLFTPSYPTCTPTYMYLTDPDLASGLLSWVMDSATGMKLSLLKWQYIGLNIEMLLKMELTSGLLSWVMDSATGMKLSLLISGIRGHGIIKIFFT